MRIGLFGRRRERGSNLVEAAIVLPVLLLLLAGVADVGRAFRAYIVLTAAAREGARYGMYFPSQQALILQRVIDTAAASGVYLVPGQVTVTRSVIAGSQEAMRVTASHQIPLVLGSILGRETLTVSSFAEMPVLDPAR